MWWSGREQVCVAASRAGVAAAVLVMLLCGGAAAGHCQSHISVTGEATMAGTADTLNVTLLIRETTEVGRLLYRLTWGEEVEAPNMPEPEEFASYFLVDDSVAGELRVLLRRSLVGLPDYPMLKTDFSTLVVFPAISGGRQCSARLSHILQDDNTHAPGVVAPRSFLQVAKSFPVATPLQEGTVTVTDNDAAAPNNVMELSVEGECPLAATAAAATTGTEAGRYGGAAGQRHTVRFHLTSPLHDQDNDTFICVLRVTDLGCPPLSSTVTFTLQVVEEESPITTNLNTDTPLHLALPFYLADVWHGMDAGTPLATYPEPVGIRGGDSTLLEVTYTLRDAWPESNGTEYFAINSATGQVRLRRALDATVPKTGVGSGGFVPLLIQAQDSSGRITSAVLQVRMSPLAIPKQPSHDLHPSSHLVSSSHSQPSQPRIQPSTSYLASPTQPNPFIHTARVSFPATSSHPKASTTNTDSLAACLCPTTSSRGLARLDFSRLSYAAEVFLGDTFVGRVEARVEGLYGVLVHYSWAPGTTTSSFLVNGTSGVISVAPAGVSPGQHHLTIRAAAGPLTTTAQVTVRVREVEEKKTKEKKQNDDGDVFIRLLNDSQRSCDPEELVGLKVAVGVLAALLGIVLLAGCVAGALLYRRRKARARTEVKHISTLGSAYPNLSFSRDSPE